MGNGELGLYFFKQLLLVIVPLGYRDWLLRLETKTSTPHHPISPSPTHLLKEFQTSQKKTRKHTRVSTGFFHYRSPSVGGGGGGGGGKGSKSPQQATGARVSILCGVHE